MPFEQSNSVLAGMSPSQLQTLLTNAQSALAALKTGQQVVTIGYGEGTGTKNVTFTKPDEGGLVQWIYEIQAALGMRRHSRRGFGVSF